jgi:hypothetical protein
MSEVENQSGKNPDTQSGETQQAPAPDIQAEIQKALDEQRQGFERELEEATGHRSLSGFLTAHRQATEETRQRLEASSGEATKYRTLYEQQAIKAAVLGACGEAINPAMVFDLLAAKAAVSEEGAVTVDGKSAQEAVSEFLDQHPYLAKPRGCPGSGTPQSSTLGAQGIAPVKNPWAKGSWNLTEQARMFRENPEQARRLKAEAGA